jgi:hypothetical protein
VTNGGIVWDGGGVWVTADARLTALEMATGRALVADVQRLTGGPEYQAGLVSG